jgi:putative sigma-54 modulation protein
MQTSVTFKNLEPSEHLKTYVSEKLDRFDKLLDNPAEASVVLQVEKHRHIAEISFAGDRLTVNGKEETGDMYSAIDMVLDKLEKQLKRSKQKIRERRAGAKGQTRTIRDEPAAVPEEDYGREIKIQSVDYKPMDVEEAVLQMDLMTDTFLVFTNARSEQINVLYRRKDGHYGLIQPRS